MACHWGSNHYCIEFICREQQCNGNTDCPDGSDEQNCPSKNCAANEFRCSNSLCIKATWVCGILVLYTIQMKHNQQHSWMIFDFADGEPDCANGDDEANCGVDPTKVEYQCLASEFSCGDGNCIHKTWLCGKLDYHMFNWEMDRWQIVLFFLCQMAIVTACQVWMKCIVNQRQSPIQNHPAMGRTSISMCKIFWMVRKLYHGNHSIVIARMYCIPCTMAERRKNFMMVTFPTFQLCNARIW